MFSIRATTKSIHCRINLPSSKSESNRALIIRELCNADFNIENLSSADDTRILFDLLKSRQVELNAHEGGTTFRFLLALLALKGDRKILSAGDRMSKRPLTQLVDALKSIGADITYFDTEGLPPVIINKGNFGQNNFIKINASVSSQFISALLMIAPSLPDGLQIELEGKVLSWPYIKMTIDMMQYFGIEVAVSAVQQTGNKLLSVGAGNYIAKTFSVSADWSAASYFYEMAALSESATIELNGLRKNSFQGDEIISEIMNDFGIETNFTAKGVIIRKSAPARISKFIYNFSDCPDLVQTIAFTCAGLGIEAELSGLETLPLKETNRIMALKTEIEKLGTPVYADNNVLKIGANNSGYNNVNQFNSYTDHRMVMSAVPLSLLSNQLTFDELSCVSKSFPDFFSEISKAGITIIKTGN